MPVTLKTRKVKVNDAVLDKAREVMKTWPTGRAKSYLRGMIAVSPGDATSDQLRILLERLAQTE